MRREEQLEADQNPTEAAISDAQQDNEPTTAQKYNRGEDKQLTMSYALIERIVKKYKAHDVPWTLTQNLSKIS